MINECIIFFSVSQLIKYSFSQWNVIKLWKMPCFVNPAVHNQKNIQFVTKENRDIWQMYPKKLVL